MKNITLKTNDVTNSVCRYYVHTQCSHNKIVINIVTDSPGLSHLINGTGTILLCFIKRDRTSVQSFETYNY
jgi:hypothetical protein